MTVVGEAERELGNMDSYQTRAAIKRARARQFRLQGIRIPYVTEFSNATEMYCTTNARQTALATSQLQPAV